MRPGRASATCARCLGGIVWFVLTGPARALDAAPVSVVDAATRAVSADSTASQGATGVDAAAGVDRVTNAADSSRAVSASDARRAASVSDSSRAVAASDSSGATAPFVGVAPDSTAQKIEPATGVAATRAPEPVNATALDAEIERLAKAGRDLAGPDRRVLTELLAAARQMTDDGDLEAALLLLSDARSFLDDKAR